MNQPSIFTPTVRLDNNTPVSKSPNLNFIAAIMVCDLLAYVGAEISRNGHSVDFILEDSDQQLPELLRRFQYGLFPSVNPMLFIQAREFLGAEVKRVKTGTVPRVR